MTGVEHELKSERERMLAGELYDPLDSELVAARARARDLCQALNATREAEQDVRRRILEDLLGAGGDTAWIQPPFFCDYGSNIELGERVYFNFNCVVLDVCSVRIGSYTLFGPAVQIYTATHPWNVPSGSRMALAAMAPLPYSRVDRISSWVMPRRCQAGLAFHSFADLSACSLYSGATLTTTYLPVAQHRPMTPFPFVHWTLRSLAGRWSIRRRPTLVSRRCQNLNPFDRKNA